jgi:hypothetical protein
VSVGVPGWLSKKRIGRNIDVYVIVNLNKAQLRDARGEWQPFCHGFAARESRKQGEDTRNERT